MCRGFRAERERQISRTPQVVGSAVSQGSGTAGPTTAAAVPGAVVLGVDGLGVELIVEPCGVALVVRAGGDRVGQGQRRHRPGDRRPSSRRRSRWQRCRDVLGSVTAMTSNVPVGCPGSPGRRARGVEPQENRSRREADQVARVVSRWRPGSRPVMLGRLTPVNEDRDIADPGRTRRRPRGEGVRGDERVGSVVDPAPARHGDAHRYPRRSSARGPGQAGVLEGRMSPSSRRS